MPNSLERSDRPMPTLSEPVSKTVVDLANDLTLARDEAEGLKQGRGRAIFLIGAGCSVSAGIPAAPGVAKHCALYLARSYSRGTFQGQDADVALDWLKANNRVELAGDLAPKADGSHWKYLYAHFFETHLKSPNAQREVINEIIDQAKNGLNWAHACLGELVDQRYVHTVLTTNFDQLVVQGIIRTGVLPVTADGLEALSRITGKPRHPQVVHLHGSMHTYNLRNSRTSMSETSQNSGAVSMIHSLLQQCDLLVVVGYGGGEEGVMVLLRDAVETLPQLVIYWVTYEKGHENLSSKARELLSGENKFSIWGGSADKFFGDLMEQLQIGQPRWVADPVTVLREQSERLRAPEAELEDVRILIGAFKERVIHADKRENRWPEEEAVKVRAAEKRTRGKFQEAKELLENMDLSKDVDAARMHALNLHSLFEQNPSEGGNLLNDAIGEFEDLVTKTAGRQRLDNILSLCAALNDKSETEQAARDSGLADRGNSDDALRRVIEVVRKWLPEYKPETDQTGNAQLNLYLAQALQVLGERGADESMLAESEAAYNEAIAGMAARGDPGGRLADAKSGLAAVLQVRGEARHDQSMLRRAVQLHRELAETSRGAERSKEEAGPLENLAGSLMALAGLADAEEAEVLRSEAKALQERAVRIYERQGDKAVMSRETLASIEATIPKDKTKELPDN
jgi:hypothetical protein